MKKLALSILLSIVLTPYFTYAQRKDQTVNSYLKEPRYTDPIRPDNRITTTIKEEPAFRYQPASYIRKNVGIVKSGVALKLLVKIPEAKFISTESIKFAEDIGISSIVIKNSNSLVINFNGKKPLGPFSDIINITPAAQQTSSYIITIEGDVVETLKDE